jgi:hypothetical protein
MTNLGLRLKLKLKAKAKSNAAAGGSQGGKKEKTSGLRQATPGDLSYTIGA